MTTLALDYDQFRECLRGERLPAALVNLDAFDQNVETILEPVRIGGKTLRIATKSVRVPALLSRLRKRCGNLYGGLMCFTVEEAEFLSGLGFDDLLIAYPTVQPGDLLALVRMARQKKTVRLVIDSKRHLEILNEAGKAGDATLQAVVEVDVSYHPFGTQAHLGVRRSPIRDKRQVLELIQVAQRLPGVDVVGLMAYEAQIAGLTDTNPFSRGLNPFKRLIKRRSIPDVASKRRELEKYLEANGVSLGLFNGGGTGSMHSTPKESSITEFTAGSGFYCPHLFDYYRDFKLEPAAFFALQVVRAPKRGMVTCHGGGYIASGEIGLDRQPIPHSPRGIKLLDFEGAGEVQTPIILGQGQPKLKLGDPVIFRHAKAGELAEHFRELLLVRNGRIVDRQPTYRGMGKNFL